MSPAKNSVILSHYNPNRVSYLRDLTVFALTTIKHNSTLTNEVFVVDGSGFEDTELLDQTSRLGAQYLASTERLGFADAYNLGLRNAKGSYLTTFANDILPPPGWDARLVQELERTHAGMAIPYLSFADIGPQCRRVDSSSPTFTPWLITLNVNMITRAAYEATGEISTEFSGGFNDFDYLIRMQRAGFKIIQADAGNVLHMGKVTVSNATSYDHQADEKKWAQRYSKRALFEHRKKHYPLSYFCLRLLASTARPRALKRRLNAYAERIEPHLLRV